MSTRYRVSGRCTFCSNVVQNCLSNRLTNELMPKLT